MSGETFDYIIVGAGSAGCVLAGRLSEDPATSVLLLEAGGRDNSLYIRMPAALSIPMNTRHYNWGFRSEPEPGLGGRRMNCPRGRVLGGCSSINGMVYARGHPLDFDGWAEGGATGWSYREVLPYFRRAETHARGGDAWRGDGGPLHTSIGRLENPLFRAFIEAGVQAGYPRSDDLNGCQQEGFGPLDMTVKDGVRWSAAMAYVHPVRARRNLRIELGVLAERLTLSGNRASGVVWVRDGQRFEAEARREVIVAAGAIGSPQLLMLSGIGPGEELRAHGIEVAVDLPGVGENLQDHLEIYLQQACTRPVSLYRQMSPLGKLAIGVRWVLTKDGIGASNQFEAGAFIRSRAGIRWPDLQYHFLPLAISYDGQTMPRTHGFQAHVGPMLPRSRGRLRLRSADPSEPPRLLFNYMSAEEDWITFRAAIRLTREIFAQPAFDPFRGAELSPGPAVQSDNEIDDFVRSHAASVYHPRGTCRMGSDRLAVVDAECRVHGIAALRVVDASVMPRITNGNLNAPTIMIAEKAADLIRGRPPLPPSEAPFWIDPEWQSRQRPGRAARAQAA
jgi:choline dehydrogenase